MLDIWKVKSSTTMIYDLLFGLVFYFSAKFVGGKIDRKLGLIALIMLTVLVSIISTFSMSLILIKTLGPGSATSNLVADPSVMMGMALFWGFRSGQSNK